MKLKKTNKKEYGKKDLVDPAILDPKNQNHKITMWIEGDLLLELRKRAAYLGAPYQTYMKFLLRGALSKDSLEHRVEKLEQKSKRA